MEPKPDYIARYEQEREAQAARERTIAELKDALEEKHRKALEENPYRPFASRLPVELMANLTAVELEQIAASEEGAFHRLQPLAQQKEEQRRAYIAAGGSEADFEAGWAAFGEETAVQERAREHLERSRHESRIF